MLKPKRDECLRVGKARQQKVAFPSTGGGQLGFWRNLYTGDKLTIAHAAGLALMAIIVVGIAIKLNPGWGGDRPWGQRIASAVADWVLAFIVLGGFLLLMKQATRRVK